MRLRRPSDKTKNTDSGEVYLHSARGYPLRARGPVPGNLRTTGSLDGTRWSGHRSTRSEGREEGEGRVRLGKVDVKIVKGGEVNGPLMVYSEVPGHVS